MPRHETNEVLRKFLHIGMGFGALLLARIPWRYAALIGVAAIIGNWLLLHRIACASRGMSADGTPASFSIRSR